MEKPTGKRAHTLGILCELGCNILFGLAFLAVSLGVEEVPVFTLLSWRFLVSFAVMGLLILLRVMKINLKGKPLLPLLVIALFQPVLYFLCETYGIALTTASESGTIIACIPIMTLLLSGPLLKERPTKLQILGIVLSVSGVVVISLVKGITASLNVGGYLLLFGAVVTDAFYIIQVRKAKRYTSTEITFVMMGSGAVCFTAAAMVQNLSAGTLPQYFAALTNMKFLLGMLYLAVLSGIFGFLLSNKSIELLGATRASSFAGLATVIAVVTGVLVQHDEFSLGQAAGTLLVLLGVYAANYVPKWMRERMEPVPAGEEEQEDAHGEESPHA